MRNTILSPCRKVAEEQNRITLWTLFHILSVISLITGLIFCVKYMKHPDRVIIQDQCGNLYLGHSRPVLNQTVAEDMARRAAIAFLDRSYKRENREMCEAVFGKTAQKAVSDIIAASKDEFAGQKITQFPEITGITVHKAVEDGQCLVWVRGILHRAGIYMEMPYYQRLEYTLGLRMMQSPEVEKFPLRVLRMTYEERSVYDTKAKK